MYINRDIEDQIFADLESENVLVITGPKGIGKTTLLKKLQKKIKPASVSIFINLENQAYLQELNDSPANLLKILPKVNGNKQYVFLDEIHNLANCCNFLQVIDKEYRDKIKLVVSSSVFDCHFCSLICKTYEVKPLSFREFLKFKDNKLAACFAAGKDISKDKLNDFLVEYIQYGGYPSVVLLKDGAAKRQALEDIINSFVNYEVPRTGIRNPAKFYNLLKLLAGRSGDFFTLSEIALELDISSPTVENYIQILRQNMKIKVLYPLAKKYSKEINKTPKFYFNDLGLRNIILGNFDHIADRWDRENYFENIVFNFLKSKGNVDSLYYWRTQTKHEVDFIINEAFAFDVSFNGGRVNKSKYKTFLKNYPEINLNFVTHSNVEGTLGVLDI